MLTLPLATHCRRFSWGLGMTAVAKSDQSTGNSAFASYAVQSGELVFAITAPYSRACRAANVRLVIVPCDDRLTSNLRVLESHLRAISRVTIGFLAWQGGANSAVPVPWFDQQTAFDFVCKHGLAVRAVGERTNSCRTLVTLS